MKRSKLRSIGVCLKCRLVSVFCVNTDQLLLMRIRGWNWMGVYIYRETNMEIVELEAVSESESELIEERERWV